MEFNVNDPKNIIGISSLMSDDTTRNIFELEKEIINGADIYEEEVNDANEFKKDMERIAKTYDLGGAGDFSFEQPEYNFDTLQTEPLGAPQATGARGLNNAPSIPINEHMEPFPGGSLGESSQPKWQSQPVEDSQLRYMTMEQKRQNYVDDVLQDIDKDNDVEFDMDKEKEEDDKNSLLEQIDMLRMTLEDDSMDLSNIPMVTKDNSLSDIQNVCRILRLKNDRNRYCSFAEELILSGAYGMEYLFDGQKEWFGRRPDLLGWSQTVKVKLRRMRYTTSTFVQEVMQEYNLSPGMRLMLELLPSMFLYSRQKKLAGGSSDNSYNEAISKLNSQMD
jgi:hypothetical protein